MKDSPLLNQSAFSADKSFSFMVRPCADLVFPYHMHPDFQLNLVLEGKGKRIVGDHIDEYTSGDLVLLGPNLPHYWTYDRDFLTRNGKGTAIIIHFNRNFAGRDFISKPELKPLAQLLDKAYRGIKIEGPILGKLIDILRSVENGTDLMRLVALINILTEISLGKDYKYLAGPAYENKEIPDQELKIKRIINFLSHHYNDGEISLERLANMASMSPTSFSKYFKKQTGQNYVEVLSDLRLSAACKELGSSDYNISQIASRCGYHNLSNFNKLFKAKYKCTPREFILQKSGSGLKS